MINIRKATGYNIILQKSVHVKVFDAPYRQFLDKKLGNGNHIILHEGENTVVDGKMIAILMHISLI